MQRFFKYHGLGNDFVVLNRLSGGEPLTSQEVIALCDRHRGIGADGVLTVWPYPDGHARMQIQNADGSESENCGNGLRCVAAFLHDTAVVGAEENRLKLAVGRVDYPIERRAPNRYRVKMGKARTDSRDLPEWASLRQTNAIELGDRMGQGMALSFGNPHLVIFVDESPMDLVGRHGASLEQHPGFPSRVNVSFVRECDGLFETVVYERGVGMTQACGSGACAVGNAAIWTGRSAPGEPMSVRLPGGILTITVDPDGITWMEGEAMRVFSGEVGT